MTGHQQLIHGLHGNHDVCIAVAIYVPANTLGQVFADAIQFLGRRHRVKGQFVHVAPDETILRRAIVNIRTLSITISGHSQITSGLTGKMLSTKRL